MASRYEWYPAGVSFGSFTFQMYITDLDCGIVYKISKFSDDTKAGGKVLTTDDCDTIQLDVVNLSTCSATSVLQMLMKLSVK